MVERYSSMVTVIVWVPPGADPEIRMPGKLIWKVKGTPIEECDSETRKKRKAIKRKLQNHLLLWIMHNQD